MSRRQRVVGTSAWSTPLGGVDAMALGEGVHGQLALSGGGFRGSCGACEEAEERFVDLLVVCPADVVRATLDGHDRHVRDQVAEACGGRLERQNAVRRAV